MMKSGRLRRWIAHRLALASFRLISPPRSTEQVLIMSIYARLAAVEVAVASLSAQLAAHGAATAAFVTTDELTAVQTAVAHNADEITDIYSQLGTQTPDPAGVGSVGDTGSGTGTSVADANLNANSAVLANVTTSDSVNPSAPTA